MTIVLDASALLALLFDEPGAEAVAAHARGAILSAVNLDEILHKCARRGIARDVVLSAVRRLEVAVHAFDADQAIASAGLHAIARPLGLSFADRACLALAQRLAVPVLTADHAWAGLDVGIDIRLIR